MVLATEHRSTKVPTLAGTRAGMRPAANPPGGRRKESAPPGNSFPSVARPDLGEGFLRGEKRLPHQRLREIGGNMGVKYIICRMGRRLTIVA